MRPVFFTHRHQARHLSPGSQLPATCSARGKVRAAWGAGAVGAFLLVHGRSVFAAMPAVYHYKKEHSL
jgi:DNA-binding IclR family transcriptional regulator